MTGLGLAEAPFRTQLGKIGPAQAVQAAEAAEQAVGHGQHVLALDSGAKQNGDKLGVAEVAGTVVPQPLPGPFPLRHVANFGLVNSSAKRIGLNYFSIRSKSGEHLVLPEAVFPILWVGGDLGRNRQLSVNPDLTALIVQETEKC